MQFSDVSNGGGLPLLEVSAPEFANRDVELNFAVRVGHDVTPPGLVERTDVIGDDLIRAAVNDVGIVPPRSLA